MDKKTSSDFGIVFLSAHPNGECYGVCMCVLYCPSNTFCKFMR